MEPLHGCPTPQTEAAPQHLADAGDVTAPTPQNTLMEERFAQLLTAVQALWEKVDAVAARLEDVAAELKAYSDKLDLCPRPPPAAAVLPDAEAQPILAPGHHGSQEEAQRRALPRPTAVFPDAEVQPILAPGHHGSQEEAQRRAFPRPSVRVLPDFPMPALTQAQTQRLKLACRMRPDVLARELFKYFVGYERYKLWVYVSNWEGSDSKAALPVCLRATIMRIIDEEFQEDHLSACRQRVNEFLRMPRRVQWQSTLEKGARTAVDSTPPARTRGRVHAAQPAVSSHTDNGWAVQGDCTRLPPISIFTEARQEVPAVGQYSTPGRPSLSSSGSCPAPMPALLTSSSCSPRSSSSPSPPSPCTPASTFLYADL